MKSTDFQEGDPRHEALKTLESLGDTVTPEEAVKLENHYKELCDCAYAKFLTLTKERNPFTYVALLFLGREMTLEDTSRELRACINSWDNLMDCMATVLLLRRFEMQGSIEPKFRIHDTEEVEDDREDS